MRSVLLVAWRTLAGGRIRFVVSVGGVALALSLTLMLNAVYAGVAAQLTSFIDRAGADVWVAQAGVRNLHMVASWLPASTSGQVGLVDGVGSVTPILYATDTLGAGDESTYAYLIGVPPDAAMGVPWDVPEGRALPGRGEIVLDRGFARRAGLGLGDLVLVHGHEARIAGLSEGTASLVNSVAFVAFEDFQAARGVGRVVSFVLVGLTADADPDEVARRIEESVPGVSAQSRSAFAEEERRLVTDMSADVIAIMDAVGFAVALAVLALTVYTATLGRRREFGALKALGAPSAFLYGVVLAQAVLSVVIAFALASALTAVLAWLVPATGLPLRLVVSDASLVKVALVSAITAGLAALLPIRQMAGLDPAIVFRRGASI
jgi:putative ABC transport system permease protein